VETQSQLQAQWVVRLPDRLVQLQRPMRAIRVFSTAEVLQFKTHYGAGESKSRIERQYDINARLEDVKLEYWVVLFPSDPAADPAVEVLCCTVQRETADRILDALWMSMFTNCGDNTFVDLRQLLAADLVTPAMAAAAPAAGRFVDLGDGDLRRPVATTGTVADAAIPVETIPSRDREAYAASANNTGAPGWPPVGHMWTPNSSRLIVGSSPVAGTNAQITPVRQFAEQLPVPAAVPESVRAAHEDYVAVQNIGRGMARDVEAISPQRMARLEAELHAAVRRQQPDNRNTAPLVGAPVPTRNPESGYYTHDGIWRAGAAILSQRDGADPPAPTLADQDARRRANPMMGLDE